MEDLGQGPLVVGLLEQEALGRVEARELEQATSQEVRLLIWCVFLPMHPLIICCTVVNNLPTNVTVNEHIKEGKGDCFPPQRNVVVLSGHIYIYNNLAER